MTAARLSANFDRFNLATDAKLSRQYLPSGRASARLNSVSG